MNKSLTEGKPTNVIAGFCISVIVISYFCAAPLLACCSLAPATFSSTLGWVGETHMNGKLVHILAYQNSAQNLATDKGKPVGNAMFLPIPAMPGTMTSANILDTKLVPSFLDDMQKALSFSKMQGLVALSAGGAVSQSVQVFEHGIYTIVLASNATEIPAALERVPLRKRPQLNKKIFEAYSKWYPHWTFALCCFDNTESEHATPMLWWYLPNDPAHLFFPGLDCHTGAVPDLKAAVDVDHFLAASTDQVHTKWAGLINSGDWIAVTYSPECPPTGKTKLIRSLLPEKILAKEYSGQLPQGDFVFDAAKVRNGTAIAVRKLPPGAAPGI